MTCYRGPLASNAAWRRFLAAHHWRATACKAVAATGAIGASALALHLAATPVQPAGVAPAGAWLGVEYRTPVRHRHHHHAVRVPEPGGAAVLAVGVLGALAVRRRA